MKILDFSFNCLKGKECAEAIGGFDLKLFNYKFSMLAKPHPELTHFDLSYNKFDSKDSEIISKNLVFNS